MTTPKQSGFKMPPEWYPHEGCWMAWPCHPETWAAIGLKRAAQAYARVALTIAEYEPVKMLVKPGNESMVTSLCGENIQLYTLPLNDSWTRDTGPTFLINENHELAGVDWIHNAWGGNYEDCSLDNQIAAAIIEKTKAWHFKAPLVMEGGSFHVDGEGTILSTRECLLNANRNPQLAKVEIENHLCNYLNAEKIIWLNKGLVGDETDGHIDEIACFIGPAKVLTMITSDKNDPNYLPLQENLEILKNTTDAKGRTLEVIPIEQPPATYINGHRLILSYINFYLANEGLIMPAFGHAKHDAAAYDLLSQIFPKRHISQIDVLDVCAGGGGIHCITQQQPSTYLK
jgi:agmatine deiminase